MTVTVESTSNRETLAAALRESEERFSKAFHLSPIGNMLVRRSDAIIVEVNSAYLDILGYRRSEMIGEHVRMLRFFRQEELRVEVRAAYERGEGIAAREVSFLRRDETVGHGIYSNHLIEIGGEHFSLGTLIDITGRKQTEQSLRDSTMRLQATLAGGGMGTWIWDIASGVVSFDDAAVKLWGRQRDDLLNCSLSDTLLCVHPDDRVRLQESLRSFTRSKDIPPIEFRTQRPDGALQWISTRGQIERDVDGNPVRFAGVFVDTTLRKKMEEAQLQSQKMEALGTLAGGVAHDFNNILLAISGNAKLAMEDLPPGHPAQRSLAEIEKASGRASDLVRRILTFSRQQEGKRVVVQLQPIVEEALRLMRPTLPTMVEIKTRVAMDVPSVAIDPIQIHQVIMNLTANAAHAIGSRGGLIELRLDAMRITEHNNQGSLQLVPGRYARLRVTDDGPGMDAQTRERIFDPFFTTKPVGQGTGLGLSVVHGIVKNLGGAISVYSQLGKGTAFDLYFPAAEPDTDEPAEAVANVTSAEGQHVMYVDDDEALVFLATRALERQGYRVTGHTSPAQALLDFNASPHAFDVVVTDLSMGGMTGLALATELMKARPDIPVLLTSGYIRDEDRESARLCGIRDFIQKPDTMGELGPVLKRLFE